MPYPNLLVQPFRDELSRAGFTELFSADEVDAFMANKSGTALLMINSVCGCAAGKARPGVRMALQQTARPERLATVLAGQDIDATAKLRAYFPEVPPSSPSVALVKDGKLAYFMPRSAIEGRDAEAVAADLRAAFAQHCTPVTA
jgi:putative YphP/YqiW family bacilliredoxin